MRSLILSKRFKRSLKNFLKKHPDLEKIIEEKFAALQKNPQSPSLKIHKLSGKLKNCLAISLTYEYRLVFYLERDSILLLAVGTHDEVY